MWQCALLLPLPANTMSSFFDAVERIVSPGYLPTEDDVLRARTKTTGIYETRFQMGQLSIQYVRSPMVNGEGWRQVDSRG
jgi:hypothetical protein